MRQHVQRGAPPRTVVFLFLVAMSALFAACDELFVGPEAAPGEVALSLSVVAGDSTPAAGLLGGIDRVRIAFTRPDGITRETKVEPQHLEDRVWVRVRLLPQELIADLRLEATLYRDVVPLFSGSAALDAGTGEPITANVELTPIVDLVMPDRWRVALDAPGDTAHLRGRAFMAEGTEIIGLPFAWVSDDPGIATVSQGGVVTALDWGETTVRMTHGSKSADVAVEVARTTIWPPRSRLWAGEGVRFEVRVMDDTGNRVPVTTQVEWVPHQVPPHNLVVSPDGHVVGLGAGSATFTARTYGVEIVRDIYVDAPLKRGELPAAFAGPSGVYLGDLAGRNSPITPPFVSNRPTRSPDLTHVVVESRDTLLVFDMEGEGRYLDLGSLAASWPEYSADGQWIYFEGSQDGASAIYRVRPDGSDLEPVSPNGAIRPTSSPDGTRIAYRSQSGLVVQDLGGRARLIERSDWVESPIWSPDGDWIAFVGRYEYVYIIRPDGAGRTRLGSHRAHPGITWSPDGSWILGSYDRAVIFAVPSRESIELQWSNTHHGISWWR